MMNPPLSWLPLSRASRLIFSAALVLLMPSTFLRAADGSWNVAAGGDWSTTTNWSPIAAPGGNGTTVNFTNNITGTAAVNLDGGFTRTAGIINIGDANGTSGFTLSTSTSAPLVFDNTANSASAQLNFVSTGISNTISAPIQLASSLDVKNASATQQNLGAISASTAGNKTITNSGSGTGLVSDAGSVISDGSGQIAIRQNSATSSLYLGGVNTYTGGTTLDLGKLQVVGSSPLGTGTVSLNGGTLANGGTAAATIAAPISLAGNVNFIGTTAGTAVTTRLVLTGAMTLTGNREVTVSEALNALGGGYVQFAGGIAESGGSYSLTKVGIGTLQLLTSSGKSITYSGGTFISEGVLKLATTGAFNTLLSTGAVTINGGTLDVAMATRTVENVGAVSLVSGSIIGSAGVASVLNATSYTMSSGTVSKALSGGPLEKVTSGTVTLSGANTYTGATTVSSGTLLVSGTGAINSTSGINVNGGQVKYDSSVGLSRNVTVNGGLLTYNSAANYSGALTFTSGSIGGTNLAGNLDNLTIGSGKSISPGNSPGTAATGNQTWTGGGSYVWEINNATGTAGSDPGWDLITGTGALTITATSGSKFNINITSLTLANVAGDAVNFSSLTSYKWKIADFSSAISFDASVFNINVAGFSNTRAPGSTFGIALGSDAGIGGNNTELYLTYAVPEPATWALLAFSLTTVMVLRRRRRE